MRYDLSRFKNGTEQIDRTYEPASFGTAEATVDDFRIVKPTRLTAVVTKSGPKVELKGRLVSTMELACSRCLEPFEIPVDATLDLTFVPEIEAAGAAKAPAHGDDGGDEVSDDDVSLSYYAGDEIDLEQMMREQFYLAMPMKPLCRPDCKGICPVCGRNRNRETCSCESTWVDPRFEVLKKLQKNEKV